MELEKSIFKHVFILAFSSPILFYAKALDMSITDDTANEILGWFSYPRNGKIVLGNSGDFSSLDEYNTAVYSKHFDVFFSFEIKNKKFSCSTVF